MFKVNNKDARTTFYSFYYSLWTYFIPFSFCCWLGVPPHQLLKAEATYCCNYWQTSKSLSEIIRMRVNWQVQLQPSILWIALFLLWKSNCSHSFFQIYCALAEWELYQGDIINTSYDTSLVSGTHILKEVYYMTKLLSIIHFFYDNVIFLRERLKQSIFQGQF